MLGFLRKFREREGRERESRARRRKNMTSGMEIKTGRKRVSSKRIKPKSG